MIRTVQIYWEKWSVENPDTVNWRLKTENLKMNNTKQKRYFSLTIVGLELSYLSLFIELLIVVFYVSAKKAWMLDNY